MAGGVCPRATTPILALPESYAPAWEFGLFRFTGPEYMALSINHYDLHAATSSGFTAAFQIFLSPDPTLNSNDGNIFTLIDEDLSDAVCTSLLRCNHPNPRHATVHTSAFHEGRLAAYTDVTM